MKDLILKPGHEVSYQGNLYRIQAPVDLQHVLLENTTTHEQTTAKIIDLKPRLIIQKCKYVPCSFVFFHNFSIRLKSGE